MIHISIEVMYKDLAKIYIYILFSGRKKTGGNMVKQRKARDGKA